MQLSPRRWAVLVAVAAVLAGAGATAFACTRLATFNLSTAAAEPGATVTFTGASFVVPRVGSDLPTTPVVVRWGAEDGPMLAELTPDRYGSVSGSFTVPEVTPGIYIILGFQRTPRVVDEDRPPTYFSEPGTPARASFEVLAPGGRPTLHSGGVGAVDTVKGHGQFDSTVWLVLTAAFGAVAVSLFGGGLIAFIHQTRKSREPARARWVPPGWYS